MNTRPHQTTSDMVNQFSQEPNYSDPGGDDYEALSRDRVMTRSLQASDIDAVLRIDRQVTGLDRRAYYERKFHEVLQRSGLRMSLVAEAEGRILGFVMARVDYGEFGRTEPAAVIDTIGVEPGARGQGVGKALVSQLLGNLASLRVESLRTEVPFDSYDLNRFLGALGFRPSQRLAFSLPVD